MWRAMLPRAMGVLPLSLAVVVLFCFVPGSFGATERKPSRRVLIIYEAGTAYPGVNLVDQGIRAALDASPYTLEVYREYMDSILFPDPADQQRFREFYIRKYQNRRPDVIITMGPSPLKFMVEMRERGFPGVPIVFCYPNWLPGTPTLASDFTGVENEMAPFETIQAALRLQPGTRHIFVVGGTSFIDKLTEALIKEQLRPYEGNFDVSYLTALTMSDLLERLKHLPKHTIVLLADLSQDAAGRKFIPGSESAPAVAAAANVPVFSMVDSFLNHGEVGGKVSSIREIGGIAGGMALRILKGERPQDVPRVKAPTIYMFDWRALKRWGLSEKNLPAGSRVLNRQPTFWELYGRYVLTGVFLLLAQAVIILALLWQRARRRKTEAELRDSQSRLEGIVEAAMDAVISIDEGQRIVVFNNAAERVFGCLARDAIGSPIERFIPERFRQAHREHVRHFDDSSIASRRTMGASGALWGLRANGKEFPIEASISQTRTGGKKLFTVIVRDITERKRAEEALSILSGRLIEAHEEERTWIARELHDDINQRIALLAVNLERLKQDSPAADGEVSRRLKEAQEHVSDLGSDIQALSHRLHSSKLEYLGLGPAAEGFCKELSAAQNVEIAFQSQDIPKNLPQEISLCIFRVLQEALQNGVKYSGAQRFEVSLAGALNEIELTVHDSGVGFDPEKAIGGHGLGLTSMKERLKSVDGYLSIHSKPQCGTTIHAKVPLKIKALSAGQAAR
jgi:PAS domain S-box-containing protein